jgi:hypothetical protein
MKWLDWTDLAQELNQFWFFVCIVIKSVFYNIQRTSSLADELLVSPKGVYLTELDN